MIALDPEHASDPDYPVTPEDMRKPSDPMGIRTAYIPRRYADDDPVWCIWKQRGPASDYYYEPVPPYGRTVAQLLEEDNEDEDEDDDWPEDEIECGCGWPDPEVPGQSHDDHIAVYDYPDHEPSPEWTPPEDED